MYRKPKRIPTIVALVILIIGIGGGIFLVENRTSTTPLADVSTEPQAVQITNLTDSSYSVVWFTNKATQGSVVYNASQSKEKNVAVDDRDIDGTGQKYITHHVTLKNLQPQNTYNFQILSEGKTYKDLNNKEYAVTTPAKPESVSQLEPAYGEVVTQEDLPAEGALVIVNMPRSLPLSTVVKSSGNWLIPLNIARTIDLKTYTSTPPIIISVSVQLSTDPTQSARATTDTDHDSPVPTIKLGKSYNFRAADGEVKETELALNSQTLGEAAADKQPDIFTVASPEQNGKFVSTKPLFRGTGIPNNDVTIEIVSPKKISGKTTVSDKGIWTWTSTTELNPESYIARISSKNSQGKVESIERNFLVFKSGTQVLGEATPSSSITVSPTPTLSPTPISGVGAPSTPSATLKPSATPTSAAASASAVPVSGSGDLTIMIISLGIVFILGGIYKLIIPSGL